MGFIVKWGIKKIFERIAENAHKTDTKIDDKLVAHKEEIMEALNKVTDKLNNEMDNTDKMLEILSVFIMNSNEPASSKAEMMEMMHGLKKYNGNLADEPLFCLLHSIQRPSLVK
jgi:anion-transporting  ArsA/GET3 family ATPase